MRKARTGAGYQRRPFCGWSCGASTRSGRLGKCGARLLCGEWHVRRRHAKSGGHPSRAAVKGGRPPFGCTQMQNAECLFLRVHDWVAHLHTWFCAPLSTSRPIDFHVNPDRSVNTPLSTPLLQFGRPRCSGVALYLRLTAVQHVVRENVLLLYLHCPT